MSPNGYHVSGAGGPGLRVWRRWRLWQLSRPFWGALLIIAAGGELMAALWWRHGLGLWQAEERAGLGQLLLAGSLIACGLLTWFHPVRRSAYSTAAVLFSILTLMTSTVGGYLAGAILGAAGGALSFAWVPAGHSAQDGLGAARPADSPAPELTLILGDGNTADDWKRQPGHLEPALDTGEAEGAGTGTG